MGKRTLTETERAKRRAEDRKRLEEAVRELQSSDGWQRWIAIRRHNGLARYSLNNQLLLAGDCWRRGISPTYVAGYRWWAYHGYQVRKGEKALRVLAPLRHRIEDEATAEQRLVVVGFKRVSVFDRSMVDPGPEPTPLEPETQPVGGDSHARHLEPLADALRAEGLAIEFGPIELRGARGYFDPTEQLIRVESGLASNARLRVLLHEAAHALVSVEQKRERAESEDAPPRLTYAEEECVVETAGHVAASSLGLDTSSEAVSYVAGWGEGDALAAVGRAATLVDQIAGWLERAALGDGADGAPEPAWIPAAHRTAAA